MTTHVTIYTCRGDTVPSSALPRLPSLRRGRSLWPSSSVSLSAAIGDEFLGVLARNLNMHMTERTNVESLSVLYQPVKWQAMEFKLHLNHEVSTTNTAQRSPCERLLSSHGQLGGHFKMSSLTILQNWSLQCIVDYFRVCAWNCECARSWAIVCIVKFATA